MSNLTFVCLSVVISLLVPFCSAYLYPINRGGITSSSIALQSTTKKNDFSVTSSPVNPITNVRDIYSKPFLAATSILLGLSATALAADVSTSSPLAEDKVVLGPPPTDFGLKYDYYTDAQLVNKFQSCNPNPKINIFCNIGCQSYALCYSNGERRS